MQIVVKLHTQNVMKGHPEKIALFHAERQDEANSRFSFQTRLIPNYCLENYGTIYRTCCQLLRSHLSIVLWTVKKFLH